MKINGNEIFGLDDGEEEEDAEKYFSYAGCDNCNNGLGNDVYDCKAWFWKNKHFKDSDFYEVKICHSCLCAHYNGGELEDGCQNIYEI